MCDAARYNRTAQRLLASPRAKRGTAASCATPTLCDRDVRVTSHRAFGGAMKRFWRGMGLLTVVLTSLGALYSCSGDDTSPASSSGGTKDSGGGVDTGGGG